MSAIPPLACAIIGAQAIFLDCRANRYFALPTTQNGLFIRLAAGDPIDFSDRADVADCLGLPAGRLLIDTMVARPLAAPAHSLTGERTDDTSWHERIGAIASTVAARASLRSAGLLRALEKILAPCPAEIAPIGTIETLSAAHAKLAFLITSTDACLARSIALARHARRSGHPVSLVIGVKLDPFAAHCWVQSGQFLLNDELDRVAPFHPILVVS